MYLPCSTEPPLASLPEVVNGAVNDAGEVGKVGPQVDKWTSNEGARVAPFCLGNSPENWYLKSCKNRGKKGIY